MPLTSMEIPQETIAAAEFIKTACGYNNMSEVYRNMLYRGRLAIIAELDAERVQIENIKGKQKKEKRNL